ncbi:MAG TPA: hypothetical protein VF476_04020 [Chitinophagaceae bacterium]
MKPLLVIVFISITGVASGQQFKFFYTTIGLGSNRFRPASLTIYVNDDTLTYTVYEKSSKYSIGKSYNDTVWEKEKRDYKVPFRNSTGDSILQAIEEKKGLSVYNANTSIMSGAIQQFYIEGGSWCTQLDLKNTFDSSALGITLLINNYLPPKHKIYVPDFWTDRDSKGLIRVCPQPGKTYREILMDDFELIRMRSSKKDE